MLRQALRRVLWLVPTLATISVLAFWVLTSAPSRRADTAVPRFFNPRPDDAKSLALEAMHGVEQGDPNAARMLAALGGAALPHVMAHLDTLSPAARTQVALALAPVAERMGLARDREHRDPKTATLFWSRLWQDRSIDFRPAAVRRAVQRLAQRPSALRHAEVRALDTYAVQDLVEALQGAYRRGDERLAARLVTMLDHVTGPGAGPDAAPDLRGLDASSAARWLAWWPEHAHRYVTYQGGSRIAAMLMQTQFGHFVTSIATAGFGLTEAQQELATSAGERAGVTATLLVSSLVIGTLLGIAWTLLAAARPPRISLSVTLGALALVALPSVAYAIVLARGLPASLLTASALLAVLSGAATSLVEGPALRDTLARRYAIVKRAFGISDRRTAARVIRTVSAGSVARLGTTFPAHATAAIVTEEAFGLEGLGHPIVQGVRTGDLPVVMATIVLSVVTVALLQLLGDLLLARVTPSHGSLARGALR